MTEFTLMDGVYLMIAAMATVFLLLAALAVILTFIGKLVDKYVPTPANQAATVASTPSTNGPVTQTEEKTLPPEKVALLMSIIFEKRAQEIKTKKL